MATVKERFSVAPARWLLDFSQAMPAALERPGRPRRVPARLGDRLGDEPDGVERAGTAAPALHPGLEDRRPLSAVGHHRRERRRLNITVFSYDGFLDVGIVVDREMVPDVWDFIDYMEDALAEL